jgi:hypothetical protein
MYFIFFPIQREDFELSKYALPYRWMVFLVTNTDQNPYSQKSFFRDEFSASLNQSWQLG